MPLFALKLLDTFPEIVDSPPRRGDVMIPECHVFDQPRGSEILRLIFPERHAAWPTIVLLVVTIAVLTDATLLLSVRPSNETILF